MALFWIKTTVGAKHELNSDVSVTFQYPVSKIDLKKITKRHILKFDPRIFFCFTFYDEILSQKHIKNNISFFCINGKNTWVYSYE